MTSLIAPNWQENYIAALRNGDLPASAAAMVGTTQKQVDFWRTQSQDFDDQCAQILEERVDALENRAYDLALNGGIKKIYNKEGVPVSEEEIVHKDLIMFMLKASRDKFNDKLITQSKVDHNINISITSFAPDPTNPREVIEGEYTSESSPEPINTSIQRSSTYPGKTTNRDDARAARQSSIEAYT